jgi:hypothetical protein
MDSISRYRYPATALLFGFSNFFLSKSETHFEALGDCSISGVENGRGKIRS